MTAVDLDALEKLAAEATPGPWEFRPSPNPEINLDVYGVGGGLLFHEDDARFIAAAREALPDLLAEVRRLRASQARQRDIIDGLSAERDQQTQEMLRASNAYRAGQMTADDAQREIAEAKLAASCAGYEPTLHLADVIGDLAKRAGPLEDDDAE